MKAKTGIAIATKLFILGVLLGLVQLWFTPWTYAVFLKLEMTLGALFLIVAVVTFVQKEYQENKNINSGEHLD